MSLMIATPMYAGQCTSLYVRSALDIQYGAALSGMEIEWQFLENESEIARGRNNMAATFLETDCDRLLFIDADIGFDAEDIARLWNRQEPLIGASVPLKGKRMFNSWKDGRMVEPTDDRISRVDFIGCAFLMIDRSVFEQLAPGCDRFSTPSDCEAIDFFSPFVQDGIYLTEDYAFCQRARDIGIEPKVDKNIVVQHRGSALYGA